ncbi:MAG: alkaline phosphatase family protein, partial [Nanoarchaeota archaeon]|nr:alkaline phosphatase family protein [Nanoarchaeota archaeon]
MRLKRRLLKRVLIIGIISVLIFLFCRYIQNIISLFIGSESLYIKDIRVNHLYDYRYGLSWNFFFIGSLISIIFSPWRRVLIKRIRKYKKTILIIFLVIFSIILLEPYFHEHLYERKPLKVLIVGLDGGEWNIINPLLEQGELPNLKKIMEEGSYGELKSLKASRSSEVWTSIATGKLPEEHGVQGFEVSRYSIKTTTLWDILNENDYIVGLFWWLVTWPPKEINGFIVPGWLSQDT